MLERVASLVARTEVKAWVEACAVVVTEEEVVGVTLVVFAAIEETF